MLTVLSLNFNTTFQICQKMDTEGLQPSELSSSHSTMKTLSYQKLVEFSIEHSGQTTIDLLIQFSCDQFKINQKHLSEISFKILKEKISKFFYRFQNRNKERSFHTERLLTEDWCRKGQIEFYPQIKKFQKLSTIGNTKDDLATEEEKPFSEKSKRAQYLDAAKVRKSFDPDAIYLAAEQTQSSCGKKDARFVLKKIKSKSGLTAAKARAAISSSAKTSTEKITPIEGLAFLLNQNLTKAQYEAIRALSKNKNADIWPSYQKIKKSKLSCRPSEIEVGDSFASVPLQNLLNHTTEQILEKNESLKANMTDLAEKNGGYLNAVLIFKFGFDGSGSHSRPMQPDSEGDTHHKKSLLASQLAPLQIVATVLGENVVLFNCPRPNNPHSCRPIRLSFETENSSAIELEHSRLQSEIESLEDYVVSQLPNINISFQGLLTMIDGKVVSALTNKNTSRCTVCDQTGPEMAKNISPFKPVSDQRLSFGASPLHFGLRTFEALLHIAYKQDVKCFRIKKTDKDTVQNRTTAVKNAFQRELGLTVDQRREGGFGNTNTGNVVRKAFENAEKTARICGVSTMLVSNLDVIRRTLASGFEINPERFGIFCQ